MTSALRFAVTVVLDVDGTAVVEKRGIDARSAEALRHEHDVLRRISHPGLVELAPCPVDGEPPPLRTFLAGGANLADRPPRTIEALTRAGAQVARTLADLHRAGIAHGGVAAGHLVVGHRGDIVLCSLRRATWISGPDHDAARQDVTDLVEVIDGWRRAAAGRRDRAWSQLDHVLAAAARHPDAGELAAALAPLGSSERSASAPRGRARRSVRPRRTRSADVPPSTDPAGAASPMTDAPAGVVGSAVRLAVAMTALVLLLRLGVGSRPSGSVAAVWIPAATLRWVAVAASGASAASAALALLARTTGDERLARAAARVGPRRMRRWAAGLTTVGLAGTVATPRGAPPSPATVASPTTRVPTTTTPPPTTTTPPPTATTPTPPTPPSHMVIPITVAPVPQLAPEPDPERSIWIVRRGDHLWGIAETTLRLRAGRDVTDDEVRPFWQAIVAANRDRLVDPANPDLIYAGQAVFLPPAA